jgi:hypothetical protein
MKTFLDATKEGILAYRIAILYGVLFSVNALAGAIIASFINVEWSSLSGTSKFLLVVAVLQIWTGTMLAFCSKTVANVQKGRLPFVAPADGDTQQFTLQQTTVATQTGPKADTKP